MFCTSSVTTLSGAISPNGAVLAMVSLRIRGPSASSWRARCSTGPRMSYRTLFSLLACGTITTYLLIGGWACSAGEQHSGGHGTRQEPIFTPWCPVWEPVLPGVAGVGVLVPGSGRRGSGRLGRACLGSGRLGPPRWGGPRLPEHLALDPAHGALQLLPQTPA